MTARVLARLALQAAPEATAAVRQRLREVVRGTAWEHRLDDAEVAATELVSNAVLHGRPPLLVTVSADDDRLRVEVHDRSAVSPTFGLLDPTAVTGRGMVMVSTLADGWGVDPTPEGKAVWAEFAATPTGSGDAADVAALLASWRDDLADPAGERVRVVLTDLPTELLARSESHTDGVLRELALLALAETTPQRTRRVAREVVAAAEGLDALRTELKRQLALAVLADQPRVDVELTVTRGDAEQVRDLRDALETADRLAAEGTTLVELPPRETRELRRALLQRVLAQLAS